MRPIRIAPVVAALALASCATKVGLWSAKDHTYSMKRDALSKEVETSLERSGWITVPGDPPDGLVGVKPGPGGHRTIGTFRFSDRENGSAFELTGGSHHVVNWLTFGILGLSMQAQARDAIHRWLAEWERAHPKS